VQARPHGPWLPLESNGQAITQPEGLRWQLYGEQLLPANGGDGPIGNTQARERTIVHDPWRPVPGRGGHLDPMPGPAERGDLDQRRDVACFTTEPLEAPLRLLGRPHLSLSVAADQPGFDLCVCLSRVSCAGEGQIQSVRQLCTGVARFGGPGCLESVQRQVALQPLMADLLPGDQLRLSVAASAWPQIALNPGDGSPPMGGPSLRHRVISLRLELEGSQLTIAPLLEPIPCSSSQPGAN